ncbi:GumC family protein [Aurantimonas sp. VKM B-3413]|uniref:GumC family protein n=1 Tax=Aurantimonas sp. VKM B-3413 TaxID=2779401 RepID=UPI001E3CEFF2|nr:GumC family protein [Aurantimonas sp. VKM B-3413]MCB8839628.1 GumC family protein [Aurantimonas sp. VKM B-3413]
MVDPLYLAGAIWARRRTVLLCTLLGLVIAVVLALSTAKKYTAGTQVLIDPRDIKIVQNEVTPNGLPSDATLALIESQMSVVTSDSVLGRVMSEAKLGEDPEFNGEMKGPLAPLLKPFENLFSSDPVKASEERKLKTLRNLREAMTVTRDAKSFVINIIVTTRDADKSAELANLIAGSFISELANVQGQTARRASDALSGRLTELRQSVVKAERAVEDYKSKNRLVGVGGRLVDDDYITRINDQLARSKGDMTTLKVKADQMRKASVDDVVKGSLPEELTSEALTRLRNTYSDLAQQAASVQSSLGPKHPKRIAIEQSLASVRSAISQELNRIVGAAQTELARAEETNRQLTQQLNDLKTKQIATSESFVKLRELEREVDASRAVYEAFLLRARETGEQESINTANVRVISQATPPLDPSSLSRRVVVLAGAFLGFLAGVAVAAVSGIVELVRAGTGPVMPVSAGTYRTGRPGSDYAPAPHLTEIRPTIHARASDLRRPADDEWDDEEVLDYERPAPDRFHEEEREPAIRFAQSEQPSEFEGEADASRVPADDNTDAHETGADAEVQTDQRRMRLSRGELRDRLRAIAERASDRSASEAGTAPDDTEVSQLQNDLLAVKEQIASIRSRRQTLAG